MEDGRTSWRLKTRLLSMEAPDTVEMNEATPSRACTSGVANILKRLSYRSAETGSEKRGLDEGSDGYIRHDISRLLEFLLQPFHVLSTRLVNAHVQSLQCRPIHVTPHLMN
jgi:hypothetical protein